MISTAPVLNGAAAQRVTPASRRAGAGIVDAIDGLAEVMTGDRRRFYQRDATTPGPDLPPTRFRTVE
jgi:hypothetical protein